VLAPMAPVAAKPGRGASRSARRRRRCGVDRLTEVTGRGFDAVP
jgi:hypothetical protein